jgi:hypothetical protein
MTILAAHLLQYLEILKYTEIQMDYLTICLLCLIFSGGVCFGNIGRLVDFVSFICFYFKFKFHYNFVLKYDIHHSSNTKIHLHSD